MKEARVHGGALDAAIRRFGGSFADWLDLSTGINPCPPPLPAIAAEDWTRLPERGAEERARAGARRFYGVGEAASIVLAPGTQSLISLWPHLFAPCVAAVVSPTYGEHETALRQAGHDVRRIDGLGALDRHAKLLVLVNPNNPDGRLDSRGELLDAVAVMRARGGLLVVDEAFMDVDPAESLARDAGDEGLLVLRSFGKFFGLAGLRIGFGLADRAFGERLAARLGPWALSGPALRVAAALMEDESVAAALRREVRGRADRLADVLTVAGLPLVGSTALFALASHARAGDLFEALARRRILTRPFAENPDWLRFGHPPSEADMERLSTALAEALAELSG